MSSSLKNKGPNGHHEANNWSSILLVCSVLGAATIAAGFYAVIWGQAQEEKKVEEAGISSLGSCKAPLLENKSMPPWVPDVKLVSDNFILLKYSNNYYLKICWLKQLLIFDVVFLLILYGLFNSIFNINLTWIKSKIYNLLNNVYLFFIKIKIKNYF